MSSFFTILLIAISLSMDAFSLALVYGMQGLSNKNKYFLSSIVGIYHFIMPLIGLFFGTIIVRYSFININVVASIILLYVGIDLIFSNSKEDINMTKMGFLLFGLSVSLDSLSIGISLKAITSSYFIPVFMFSITSFFFTYLGIILGDIIGNRIGSYSKITGGIVLIIIALTTFFHK